MRIDNRRWNRTLRPVLEAIRDDLGLPPASSLDAQLHSMLVYEARQFFAPHQDSEKDDAMVGTLVVMLPSRSTGGELVVEHRGESVRYQGSASSLTFVAFYADTRHEVLPVETGNRVVLTYNLLLSGNTSATPTELTPLASTAAELLDRHFKHTPEPRWRGDRDALEPPDRLVVLLDHQYTERGLRWSQLKGEDAARAGILRQAAELATCEIALAEAEIHETRECYDDAPRRGWRRGWSEWDDEPDESPDSGLAVGEILDSTVTIAPAAGGHCCDDCTTLTDFLSDPKTRKITWPLAKPRRQHIHQRIDEAELPVTHHTTRLGSPHKLEFTKSPDLHLRETACDRATTKALDLVQRYLNSTV